jgi:hypothetical protein
MGSLSNSFVVSLLSLHLLEVQLLYLLCPVFAVNCFFDRASSVPRHASKHRGRPGRTQSLAAGWIALTPKRGEAPWTRAYEENGGRRRQREPFLTAKIDGKRKPNEEFTNRGQSQYQAVTGASKRKRKCDKTRPRGCACRSFCPK